MKKRTYLTPETEKVVLVSEYFLMTSGGGEGGSGSGMGGGEGAPALFEIPDFPGIF